MPKHDTPTATPGVMIHRELAHVLQEAQALGQQWDIAVIASVEHLAIEHPKLNLQTHTGAFNEACLENTAVYSKPCPTTILPLLVEVQMLNIFGAVEACIEAEHRDLDESIDVSSDPQEIDLQIVQVAGSLFNSVLHNFLVARLTARAEAQAATKH